MSAATTWGLCAHLDDTGLARKESLEFFNRIAPQFGDRIGSLTFATITNTPVDRWEEWIELKRLMLPGDILMCFPLAELFWNATQFAFAHNLFARMNQFIPAYWWRPHGHGPLVPLVLTDPCQVILATGHIQNRLPAKHRLIKTRDTWRIQRKKKGATSPSPGWKWYQVGKDVMLWEDWDSREKIERLLAQWGELLTREEQEGWLKRKRLKREKLMEWHRAKSFGWPCQSSLKKEEWEV